MLAHVCVHRAEQVEACGHARVGMYKYVRICTCMSIHVLAHVCVHRTKQVEACGHARVGMRAHFGNHFHRGACARFFFTFIFIFFVFFPWAFERISGIISPEARVLGSFFSIFFCFLFLGVRAHLSTGEARVLVLFQCLF